MEFGAGKSVVQSYIYQADESSNLGYDNANQTAYLDSTIRWGMDWLIDVSICL